MLRNLASSLILTERDAEFESNEPKVKGRVTTTLHKAKEVRPLVERCITIARRSLKHQDDADQFATDAERGSDEWKTWRSSDEWQKWCQAIAPTVAARRRALRLLGDKQAVQILFDEIAPRFADRDGGYTRVLKLAKPRLGDGGAQAVLEFVGVHDRETTRSEKPAFADEETAETEEQEEPTDEAEGTEDPTSSEQEPEASADDNQEGEGDDDKSED
jgi:large subunit ribosomal protein L17